MKNGSPRRNKGKRGEREAAAYLRTLGFDDARRGQQYKGTPDSPDVQCSALEWVRVEVKVRASPPGPAELESWWEQAEDEARDAGKCPALLWRANRLPWRLVFVADQPPIRVEVEGAARIKAALTHLNTTAGVYEDAKVPLTEQPSPYDLSNRVPLTTERGVDAR